MSERINISENEIKEVLSKISLRFTNSNNYRVVRLYTNATTLDHIYLVCAHRVYAEDMEVLKRCLGYNLTGYSVTLEKNASYMVIRSSEHTPSSNKLSYDEAINLLKANSHVFHLEHIDTNYDEAAKHYLEKTITSGSVTGSAPITSSHATVIARFFYEPIIAEMSKILISGGIDINVYCNGNTFYIDGYSERAYSTAYDKALAKVEMNVKIIDNDMQSLHKEHLIDEPVNDEQVDDKQVVIAAESI